MITAMTNTQRPSSCPTDAGSFTDLAWKRPTASGQDGWRTALPGAEIRMSTAVCRVRRHRRPLRRCPLRRCPQK